MAGTISIAKKYSFYENIVFKLLSKMDKGTLTLTLPDGEQVVFGDGEINVCSFSVVS